MRTINIHYSSTGITVKFAYSTTLLADLKAAIPNYDMSWNPASKEWTVHPRQLDNLMNVARKHDCHTTGDINYVKNYTPVIIKDSVEVHYIGNIYKRSNNELTAFGWWSNGWNAIFINDSLQSFFKVDVSSYTRQRRPNEIDDTNYYTVLVVNKDASQDEIKKKYKFVVKQWHPDICKEPDARERFELIQKAYSILSDDTLRAKYNFGLELAHKVNMDKKKPTVSPPSENKYDAVFKPQIRCGKIIADVEYMIGRAYIHKIHDIEEIVNEQGQVMVSYWNNTDTFGVSWVDSNAYSTGPTNFSVHSSGITI